MAMYYLSSSVEGRTRVLYATKYAMKQPLTMYKAIVLFKASLKEKQKHLEAAANMGDTANYNATLLTLMIVMRCFDALIDKKDYGDRL